MGKLNVKNGTPVGNANLCKSCIMGQCISGYRESDLLVICNNTSPNIVVPFTVYECSGYSDKHKPTWEEMKKLAVNFQPLRISRTAGFSAKGPSRAASRNGAEGDGEDEVALVR
jgi:hypothetical protein